MKITIRDSSEDDINEIFSIRQMPEIRANQYPLSPIDHPAHWKELLVGKDLGPLSAFYSKTITVDNQIVGHVMQTEERHDSFVGYKLGFNIHPEFWGKGIMSNVLETGLEELFVEKDASAVVCDCFWNNSRCRRLLEKNRFERIIVPISERINIVFATWCFRWIVRYQILEEDWSKTRRTANN